MIPGQRNAMGQLFTLSGPAPAGSPFRSGIANSNDGQVYISSGAAAFSPADLFASGEQGVWYDPSDMSTMFQDSAGTTPVTAAGQPVGKLLDKSGRGNHATQATAAKRPLLQTSGGLWWLEFDGVDDVLQTANIDMTVTSDASVFVGFSIHLIDLFSHIVNLGDGLQGSVPGGLWCSVSDVGKIDFEVQGTGVTSASAGYNDLGAALSVDTAYVQSAVAKSNGSSYETIVPYIDTAVKSSAWNASGTGVPGSGTFGNLPLFLGRVFSRVFNGKIYQAVLLGRTATSQEITNTKAFVAAKSGVTLP